MNGIVDRLLLSLIVVIAMLLLACMGHSQSGRNQSGTTPPDKVSAALTTETALPGAQSVAKSSLEKEAEQAAEAFLKRTYYKCGDSYFKRLQTMVPASWNVKVDPDPRYYQVKGFAWKVEGSEVIYPPLTEADRLNGVKRPVGEWKGEILVTVTVFRAHTHRYGGGGPKEWTAWIDMDRFIKGLIRRNPYDRFPIEKRSGKWIVLNEQGGPIEGAGITPVDCNAIPPGSLKVSQVPDPKPPQIKNPAKPVRATVVADPLLVPPDAVVKPIPKKP